jgi:hypothetical protein
VLLNIKNSNKKVYIKTMGNYLEEANKMVSQHNGRHLEKTNGKMKSDKIIH